jgi:Tol biopolymer transport system component
MSNAKSVLIILLVISTLFAASCARPAAGHKPSGLPSLIAFSSDRASTVHIYTIKPDGTDNMSTSNDPQTLDGLPAWTSDGSRILFTSNQSDDNEIWSMNSDGSDRKKLTDLKGWDGLASMSPDGSKIVFAGERNDAEGHGSRNIFIMNSDGSDARQLTGIEESENYSKPHAEEEKTIWNSVPAWSPDGSKILFSSNRELVGVSPVLYTINPDGSGQQKFGFPFTIDGTGPDWSPITNKIVFVRGSEAKGDIWIMDASSPFPGWTAKKITDNIDNNHSPVWSPDGQQIAFISDTYGNDDIFIMNADGSNVRRVTYDKSNERYPTWR